MLLIIPCIGIVLTSSTALLTSIAVLIPNEHISKFKTGYTKSRDWINVITLIYEKTLEQSMIDKNINQKEAEELKKIHNPYLDKRKQIMQNTQFKVEHVNGDNINKDDNSKDQIIKVIKFLDKMM